MRIKYLAPYLTDRDSFTALARRLARSSRSADTHVSLEAMGLAAGLPADGMGRLAMETEVVALGAAAEAEGFDAIVVDSILDAGVDALRSRLGIPVIGAGRCALVYGPMLGGKISVAVRTADERRAVDRAIIQAEVSERVASVVAIGSDAPIGADAVRGWAVEAVERGGAGALILAHPTIAAFAADLGIELQVQVIDPGLLALKVAEAVVDLQLGHSTIAYLAPAAKLDHLIRERVRTPEVMTAEIGPAPQPPPSYRIKVVVPISGMTESDVGLRAEALAPGLLHETTRVDYRSLSDSSNSGDCQYDTFLLDLFCAEEEMRADEEGYDAVLVDSTTDSGITSVRPHLDALALGPGEACWALASVLGDHFTILSMERKWEFFFIKGPKSIGLLHRLASVEDVGTAPDPVRLFEGKEELMNQLLIEAARRGIDEHRADVVIIGSTTMHQALPALTEALPVPVLSPGRVGVRTAEMLLDLGLRHTVARPGRQWSDPSSLFEAATRKAAPIVRAGVAS